jgi:hypothetical protein
LSAALARMVRAWAETAAAHALAVRAAATVEFPGTGAAAALGAAGGAVAAAAHAAR